MAQSLEISAPVERDRSATPGSGSTYSSSTNSAPPGLDWAGLAIASVAGLGLTLAALFFFVMPFAGHLSGSRDFVSYWATGRQLVHHFNPYDREAIGKLEHALGLDPRAILIMRNPPWALVLAWPLGWMPFRVAAFLWSLVLLGCLAIAVSLLRRHPRSTEYISHNYIHWLGLGFTPALLCLTMGQTSLFALLGLVLFLRFHAERPFAAGLALWLCALKPHLFLPFTAALALWIVVSRSWKIVAGAVVALAATSAISLALDPRAWSDYLGMLRSPLVNNEFIPCLSDALHHWLWPHQVWTQYLPAALACIWAVAYYWRRRAHWNWMANGSPLILVSLLLAPYAWFYDQCLAIPALLFAAYAVRHRILLTAVSLAILATYLQLRFVHITSPLWLWTAPAWFAWYLLAARSQRSDLPRQDIAQAL